MAAARSTTPWVRLKDAVGLGGIYAVVAGIYFRAGLDQGLGPLGPGVP
jgi:hypothetical protein